MINRDCEPNHLLYYKEKVKNNWLGFEGASEAQILKRESELNIKLPASYREFLKTSNGFEQISIFVGKLMPVEEIDWLAKKDEEFIQIMTEIFEKVDEKEDDERYNIYGENQSSVHFRMKHLFESLMVSHWTDGATILLNPAVRFGDEWEAWIYASWYPGAHRYRSFRDGCRSDLSPYNS